MVVSSLKSYLRVDADVALFAKCLKNECDQEFRSVQGIARDQVFHAFKCVLREKHPRGAERELAAMADSYR